MKTSKKVSTIVGLAVTAVLPFEAMMAETEMSEAIVLAYAVLMPLAFVIVSIAGIIAASLSDITGYFRDVATFGWRPGKAHLAERSTDRKRV